ncbi:OmpA family protein [Streptomyces sp. NPDC000410]|uniref:OmpA family protein n=1 Tax=Streptomyces sp. NPDC000410 TaxID=3154254 RepID=UPI0033193FB4
MATAMLTRRRLTLVSTGALVLTLAVGPSALADDSPYPSATSVATEKVDVNDPDLKMVDGATLAPPKVLEIKTVVGDEGGNEQREDSNSNVKFNLQAEVLFGKDSAKLSPLANSRIKTIAEEIKKQSAKRVRVFGFTDNLGSSAHGDVLSKQRADAVHSVLVKELGSSGITFEVRGYGEQYPIADNAEEEGRKKNRRVEVSFPRGAN